MLTLSELTSRHACAGHVKWIGIRPNRREDILSVNSVEILKAGLEGDHYAGTGKRAVTLIQHEHLAVIASLLERPQIDPSLLRRNIVVSGINLLAMRNSVFQIGDTVLQGAGICAPCSRMEETFGNGGYNAVRGHGGITAKVLNEGNVKLGDRVFCIANA